VKKEQKNGTLIVAFFFPFSSDFIQYRMLDIDFLLDLHPFCMWKLKREKKNPRQKEYKKGRKKNEKRKKKGYCERVE
jgi:hypothetical protein